jgi:hypothetical protein
MSEPRRFDPSSTPTIEVQVFRNGRRIASERCDSEDDAAEAVARWSEQPGVECTVEDIATRSGADDILYEPEPIEDHADEYPEGGPQA